MQCKECARLWDALESAQMLADSAHVDYEQQSVQTGDLADARCRLKAALAARDAARNAYARHKRVCV